MSGKYNLFLLFIFVLFQKDILAQNEIKSNDYNFVYIALDQDDNTNYQKLIVELKKLNSVFIANKQFCVLYFTKGTIRFNTNQLNEWEKVYPLINGNGVSRLYAKDEVDNILELFKKNEFSNIEKNKLSFSIFNRVIWHCFIGNGFWQAENNKNILGILIASSGIYDRSSSNFQLIIYHDSDETITYFNSGNALGRYYSFITDKNTFLKEY